MIDNIRNQASVDKLKPNIETFVNKSIFQNKNNKNPVDNISNDDSLCTDKNDTSIQRQTGDNTDICNLDDKLSITWSSNFDINSHKISNNPKKVNLS